jgi:hypothetical protein
MRVLIPGTKFIKTGQYFLTFLHNIPIFIPNKKYSRPFLHFLIDMNLTLFTLINITIHLYFIYSTYVHFHNVLVLLHYCS